MHPDNAYAQRVEHEFGKTEIWYVLDAVDDATLIYGFNKNFIRRNSGKAIEENTLMDVLQCC